MKDIARNLGVSHVTVSCALRGVQRISKQTRDRVCEEAKRLGYRPDPVLQVLSQYRIEKRQNMHHASLAWLCCWESAEQMYRWKEFSEYKRGALSVAERLGYRLEEFVPFGLMSPKRIQNIIHARGIQGILIPPRQSHFSINLDLFNSPDIAVVKFGHSHPDFRSHLVTSAHVHNTMLAYENMRRLGYKRVGFVISKWIAARTHFITGFLRAQVESNPSEKIPLLILEEKDVISESPSVKLADWLRRENPDSILTPISGMSQMLRQASYQIPHDIGLAALSIHDGNADAGIDQNPFEIGKASCEMLTANITHRDFGRPAFPRELLIQGSWKNGDSLPPRK